MRVAALLPALIAPTLGYSVKRDGKSVIESLSTISEQLKTMNATLDTINGGPNDLENALAFHNEATQLEKEIQTATSTAKDSAAFSSEESSDVAYSVVGLTHLIYPVLSKTTSKRDIFIKFEVTGLVLDEVGRLQNLTEIFGTTLTEKFVKPIRDVAPLLISAIDFHFYDTLQAYS